MNSDISPNIDGKALITKIPDMNHYKDLPLSELESFKNFPFQKFPPEIRCMVWRMSVSEPRIVTYRKTPLPLALQINKESRYEAQKVLELMFALCNNYGAYKLRNRKLLGHELRVARPTYIQPGIDILEVHNQFITEKLMSHPHINKVKAVLLDENISGIYLWPLNKAKFRSIVQFDPTNPSSISRATLTIANWDHFLKQLHSLSHDMRRPELATRAQVQAELNHLK